MKMKRNESPFNKLILVDGDGQAISRQDLLDDAAVDYPHEADNQSAPSADRAQNARNTLLVFAAVSITCMAAALATGSYAVWLGRRQAAQKAIIDVNDLLKTCQTRMRQLEMDVQNLPSRAH